MGRLAKPVSVAIPHHAAVSPAPSHPRRDDVERVLNGLMQRMTTSASPASWSCQTYDRLLSGETVSWAQILLDHPLLGAITVRKLVEAGAVQVKTAPDSGTATIDAWLTLQNRAAQKDEGPTGLSSQNPRKLQ